jgi:hypothetical protein
MTGGELTWGVIRDRDANLDRVINGYRRLAEEKGIDNLLIWPFYSIENLFLSPSLIFDAVTERTPQLTLDVVRDKLEEITTSMHDEVLRLYISRAQIEYRRLDLGSEALRDSIDFVNGLARLSDRLMYYPGKKIFGQLVQWLQNEHGLNLRMDDLIEAINVDDPPEACREFLRLVSEMEND